MDTDRVPDGWVVWNEEREKIVFAYRPDVFDGGEFPSACLPTIYVTRGQRDRRPGGRRVGADWYVTLYLEPDVERGAESFDSRETAIDGALSLAEEFARGEIAYRDLYQVGRPDYFERLDELTGRVQRGT